MSDMQRLHRITYLIQARKCAPIEAFLDELEISKATFSSETWHGQQVGSFDKDGNHILEFDYSQDPELVMDILKYGSGVEVLAPAGLRKRVKDELTKALKNY